MFVNVFPMNNGNICNLVNNRKTRGYADIIENYEVMILLTT